MSIAEKLIKIAENEQKVYESGESDGYNKANSSFAALIDRSITELKIPEGVKMIGRDAFSYTTALKKVELCEGLEYIDTYGFRMSGIVEMEIPQTVRELRYGAVYGCPYLKTFKSGAALDKIETLAFYNCRKCLLYDFSQCKQIPSLVAVDAFELINAEAKILVPAELYHEWIETTNWSYYKDYIVAVEKAAPDQSKFNVYVDANTLQEIVNYDVLGIKLGHGVGENYIRNDGGVPYLRIHGDGTSNEAYAIVQNVNKQKTGKYLVYAYRIPTSNTNSGQHYFQIYANTTNDTPSGKGDMFYVRTQQDGKWHVDIIDIEAAINSSSSVVVDKNPSKFTPSNGEYITQKLRFDWFNVDWAYGKIPTSDYIDIAYIALCDSLELARAADPDYTGKEFSLEYFTSRLGSEIKVTEHGMKYAVVNATTDNSGESWIWLSEDNYEEYRIIPNTTMYVGVLYKDAPVRANGKGAWGEIYACSANDSLTNSSWYSLGRIDPYDTSSGWHFGIMKFKAPLADAACRLMRFDFLNGLSANTAYTMNIAFVKCFTSEEEANAYYQSYKTKYNI